MGRHCYHGAIKGSGQEFFRPLHQFSQYVGGNFHRVPVAGGRLEYRHTVRIRIPIGIGKIRIYGTNFRQTPS
ncbi:hypothetical protein D3C83_195280 [compost metagenome]